MTKGLNNKPHIGIFGRRNTGKSSFINAIVDQQVAIVSDQPGTTTDPVKKSIEIFGIGPAIVIDTAGIDDVGELGRKRVARTREMLKVVDGAVLLISGNHYGEVERKLIHAFGEWNIPYLIIHNKSDIEAVCSPVMEQIEQDTGKHVLDFSAVRPVNLDEIIDALKEILPATSYKTSSLLGDLVTRNDYVLLVTPIDLEAPEGRMILPQVMAIRDVLDNDCISVVLKETQLAHFLATSGIRPALVITDSQAFGKIKDLVPEDIPLTSFSIVLARRKGNFGKYLEGTPALANLRNGDKILILESCTHQVKCDDIGRYKLPRWIRESTGKYIEFDVVAGLNEIPGAITDYAMVIQCGGCMITQKQLHNRLKPAIDAGIPVSNYGLVIAYIHGIFDRASAPFQSIYAATE